jgi:hypothetical protein
MMSKLGKIFIVKYRAGEYSKEVYPVVYENQERYVCKVPGCHEIREFLKDNSRYGVITVEEFYREVQMGLNPSHAYKVFVSNQDKIDFEKYRTVSPNEINLKKLEAKLDYDEKRIEIWKNEIEDTKKRINDMKVTNRQTKAKIAQLKALIEKEKNDNE